MGRARGNSRGRCRMPKPHSDGVEGTLVMGRSDNTHINNIRHTWRVHPDYPRREGLKEQHSHFSGPPGPGREA